MSFERLEFEKTWLSSTDFPTYEDSEQQVRSDLQYHPEALRAFLNEVLLPALEAPDAAGSIGASVGETTGTLEEVLQGQMAAIEQVNEDIETLAAGGVPPAAQCVRVEFTKESWSAGAEGASMAVPKEIHKRKGPAFGYALWETVDGAARSDTWGVLGTQVAYDEDTGAITLTGETAYAGAVVFFGV